MAATAEPAPLLTDTLSSHHLQRPLLGERRRDHGIPRRRARAPRRITPVRRGIFRSRRPTCERRAPSPERDGVMSPDRYTTPESQDVTASDSGRHSFISTPDGRHRFIPCPAPARSPYRRSVRYLQAW